MNRTRALALAAASIAGLLTVKGSAGQEANPTTSPAQQQAPEAANSVGAPIRLTLQDALDRARKNSVPFNAAQTTAALARQDRTKRATRCSLQLPTTMP
jgi:hypothetical protein